MNAALFGCAAFPAPRDRVCGHQSALGETRQYCVHLCQVVTSPSGSSPVRFRAMHSAPSSRPSLAAMAEMDEVVHELRHVKRLLAGILNRLQSIGVHVDGAEASASQIERSSARGVV